jgi:hypothetical protein
MATVWGRFAHHPTHRTECPGIVNLPLSRLEKGKIQRCKSEYELAKNRLQVMGKLFLLKLPLWVKRNAHPPRSSSFRWSLAPSPPISPNCILRVTHYEQVSHRMMFIARCYWLQIENIGGGVGMDYMVATSRLVSAHACTPHISTGSLLLLILALRLSIPFLYNRRVNGSPTLVCRQFGKEYCGF